MYFGLLYYYSNEFFHLKLVKEIYKYIAVDY